MNQRNQTKLLSILAFLILLASLMACSNTEPTNEATIVDEPAVDEPVVDEPAVDMTIVDDEPVVGEGNTDIDAEAVSAHLTQDGDITLTAVEIEGLLFMREEEKLARDVYLTLGELWQMNIFQNISRSEQTHTDAIKVLLDQYGLDDPMTTDEVGVFENEELQALYDSLVETGSQSLEDALRVGAAIEEIDILDLEEYIGLTDNVDIQIVYQNLTKGSRNHLRSFVSVLEKQTGETYAPQYLSLDAYETIIDSAMERGGEEGHSDRNGNNGGNGHGNGNGNH